MNTFLLKIVTALKDPWTSIPALIAFIAQLLQLFGVALPVALLEATKVVAITVVGLSMGTLADLSTTIPTVVGAVCYLLNYFGIVTFTPVQVTGILTLLASIWGFLGTSKPKELTETDGREVPVFKP